MAMTVRPIALLITAYNRQELLDRALASLAPEIDLLDIVLVDDGSTPPITIEKFAHYPIHLIRLPSNRGTMAASNAGLDYIYAQNYEFIARLDSDDTVINQRFTKQLAFLRAHPDIGVVGANFHIVNRAGEIRAHSTRALTDAAIRKAMHLSCMLHHPTLIMRSDAARRAGLYNTQFAAAGDYEFCWRLLGVTKAANLPDSLLRYEMGEAGSISRNKRFLQAFNALKIRLRHFDFASPYSYLGLIISVMEMTNTLRIIDKIKAPAMRLLRLA